VTLRWTTTLDELDVAIAHTARGPIEFARTGGTGQPAVLLVHGTPGSWRQAVPLAEDLAGEFDVALPSRPGYGRTPLRTGRTYDEQADAYAALLDGLGIERCAVVGVSGGGPSSLAFASRHADRTTALIQVCALVAHLIRPAGSVRLLKVPGLAEAVSPPTRALARRKIRRPGAIDAEMRRSLTPDEFARAERDPRIRDELVRFALSHQEAPAGIAGLRNDLTQVEWARRSPADVVVRCPALVMHGGADTVVPIEHAHHHASTIPGARLLVYEDAGHVFMLTRRTEATAEIRTFLAEHA
jgi:pimeloyl-ACP methyl ester carboxylesterase